MKRATARLAVVSLLGSALASACGWDPSRPFEREAPKVNEAIAYYDGGEADSAATLLSDYLLTGTCSEGNIGTPNRLNERPSATFDLGLALFRIGEAYGQRFGDEEDDAGALNPTLKGQRANVVECALRILRRISEDASQPVALRARARYLEGNLLFLTAAYKEAVDAYDKALELAPGMNDGGPIGLPDASQATFTPDSIGRDAAYNRAIALRRIEDKKDAGSDGGGDGGGEGGGGDGGGSDAGGDGGGSDDQNDAGNDSGGGGDPAKDSGNDEPDAGGDPPPKPESQNDEPDAGAPPPPSRQSQDERILDQLENAPTVQQEAAKKQAGRRKVVHGMADK